MWRGVSASLSPDRDTPRCRPASQPTIQLATVSMYRRFSPAWFIVLTVWWCYSCWFSHPFAADSQTPTHHAQARQRAAGGARACAVWAYKHTASSGRRRDECGTFSLSLFRLGSWQTHNVNTNLVASDISDFGYVWLLPSLLSMHADDASDVF